MFEQIAKAEAWIKANGPGIRHELERVAKAIEDAAIALERIALEANKIRRAITPTSEHDRREDTIDGTAIDVTNEPAER